MSKGNSSSQSQPIAGSVPLPAREAEKPAADLLRDMFAGRACWECGDPLEGSGCPTCAEKHDMLRQAFPNLYGDS